MPHFTLSHTAQAGPILDMIVGSSAPRILELQAAGQVVPVPQNIRALLDTGASCTCIDPTVLNALGLQPTGNTSISTPSTGATPVDAYTYDVSIVIPAGNQQPLIRAVMSVCASELIPLGYKALLGRDILSVCHVTYNGSDGFFTLAY